MLQFVSSDKSHKYDTYDWLLPETVFQQRETQVAGTEEDNSRCQPNFKTVEVNTIYMELEAQQDVVDDSNSNRGRDTNCISALVLVKILSSRGKTYNTRTCRPSWRSCSVEEPYTIRSDGSGGR